MADLMLLTCIYCMSADVLCKRIPVVWTEVREWQDDGGEAGWTHVGVCPHHWCREEASKRERVLFD